MSIYKNGDKILNSITAVEEAKVKEITKEEVNNDLAWKSLDTVTGNTAISYPSNCKEFIIYTWCEKTSISTYYVAGMRLNLPEGWGYVYNGNKNISVSYFVNYQGIQLVGLNIQDTDRLADASTKIYYR